VSRRSWGEARCHRAPARLSEAPPGQSSCQVVRTRAPNARPRDYAGKRSRRSRHCGGGPVKPSAQPTLVRTQHLPPVEPQVTALWRSQNGSGVNEPPVEPTSAQPVTCHQVRKIAVDLGLCGEGRSAFSAVAGGWWRARAGVHAGYTPKTGERKDT